MSSQETKPSYYSPENILRYAEALFNEGDFLRAAGEYARYLFCLAPGHPSADEIVGKIGLCLRLGKQYQRAITFFDQLVKKGSSPELSGWIYQGGLCYFSMGEYDRSLEYIEPTVVADFTGENKRQLIELKAMNLLYKEKWQAVKQILNSSESGTDIKPASILLTRFAQEGENLSHKSKLLAGLMSAIVPGSGKIYAGRAYDGIVSFLTIAMTTWQAVDGFRTHGSHSTKGWIYGIVSGFFYLGNIYGSVVSVKIYNQQVEKQFFGRVGVALSVHIK